MGEDDLLTAYDLYYCLKGIIDSYMDSILLKEDPTDLDKKNYEYLKEWLPKDPDTFVKNILDTIKVSNGEESGQTK